MKKILALVLVSALVFVSCEGDQGPPGQDGLDGLNGHIFEAGPVDLSYDPATNLYSAIINFADETDFEILDTDAVLVYRLQGSVEFNDGTTADSWALLPLTYTPDEGTFYYTFEHNYIDTEIFIDGNFDLSGLASEYTQDQIFRIVIIPNPDAQGLNVSNFDEVLKALNPEQIKQIEIKN
ncbi:hypothetical protein SAMN02927921_02402 [Sinomicrobium oceani]|uniref:Uncharacterized protein n=1 Tax=Sinomicrobium oceani TaxID=1150368 RepID=A0A1K1QBH4_9FLAO|nr:hypothetical protein [Sinomicrobium oceani]SFW57003.1 hypothetical protein SAMN02927921_02402 [Sinomicrobium oceani]